MQRGKSTAANLKHIRALTFDLDDTLWDNTHVLIAAEQSLYDWLALHYPRIKMHYSAEGLHNLCAELLQHNPQLRHDVTALRKNSLRIAADAAGYDHDLVEPAFAVFLHARHQVRLYEDVVPALQRLRAAGYFLGTLTNGNADVQRLGLGHLFDFSLSAASTGKAKPHPRMFEEACRRAQVSAAHLAHVGDEPGTDLAGAQNAGVTVIWMNRRGQLPSPDVGHHAQICNMSDLLKLLELD